MTQQMPYHLIVIVKELGETGGRMWVMKKIQQELALHSGDAFEWNDFGNPRFLYFPKTEFLNLIAGLPCCCSVTWLYSTIRNPIDCSKPGCPILHHFTEFAQTPVHWVGDAIQSSHPLSPPSPSGSIFPSIMVFSNESALRIMSPKYCSFSISPSNEYSGNINI